MPDSRESKPVNESNPAWGTLHLVDFLAALSTARDGASAMQESVERAVQVLDADTGLVVSDDAIAAATGCDGEVAAEMETVPEGEQRYLRLPEVGVCSVIAVPVDAPVGGRLVLARSGHQDFSPREVTLLEGMGRVLGLTLVALATIEDERRLRARSEQQARENAELLESVQERQELLERLARIQRSISHRAPLQEVLDAITAGARNLLGEDLAALRLIDPDDPSYVYMASHSGIREDLIPHVRRGPAHEGVGGRAVLEERLVIITNYQHAQSGIPRMKEDQLQSAMAAPVYENGEIAGGLLVASYKPGRSYSKLEQEALLAFAEHASLALTDAKTVESMREAQRAKDMFLAMVSHELKTPLTVLLGTLHTFERHPELPPEVRKEMVASAQLRGRDLSRLIDRLLKGARGELATVPEEIFLPELVHKATRGFEQLHPLVIGAVPEVKLHVDARVVEDVLGVFLENAVSHSPPGAEVAFEAHVGDDTVALTVRNEGSLPDDVDPSDLFRPFQRGRAAQSPGVGLGLYIAGRLARAAGGSIETESGGGYVAFTLKLPLHGPKEPALQPAIN
jgi:K+-sensing histidine kinase KdpD